MRRGVGFALCVLLCWPAWAQARHPSTPPVPGLPDPAFGVGCANACGREEIVLGGSAVCTAVLTNDSTFTFHVLPTSTVTVSDADGTDVLPVLSGTVDVVPTATVSFPVTIATDAQDVAGDTIRAQFLLHSFVEGFPNPIDESAGAPLTIIPVQTCFVTTTTTVTTVTEAPPATTTTTTLASLPPRLRVCDHNDNPKKCR